MGQFEKLTHYRIEHRTEVEQSAARAIGAGPTARRTVLLAGNSLPLEGIDFPALQSAISPEFKAVRYIVEQTAYLDWYYGLRSLYASGVRPGVVALSLNAAHMVSNQIRGDYFAYRMMMARDCFHAAHDAGLSATETSSLLLGSLSAFYGARSEIRKVLLSKVIPSVKDLIPFLTPIASQRPVDGNLIIDFAGKRLQEMDSMVRAHGGRLILIVPATMDPQGPASLLKAGEKAGVPVLIPLAPDTLSPGDFQDGFHLNPEGAARYTASLNPMLKEAVAAALR